MDSTTKKKLNIDNSIIICNAERIKQKRSQIKDKKHLSRILADKMNCDADNLYMRIYRAEKNGFLDVDNDLLKWISEELEIPTEDILIEA